MATEVEVYFFDAGQSLGEVLTDNKIIIEGEPVDEIKLDGVVVTDFDSPAADNRFTVGERNIKLQYR